MNGKLKPFQTGEIDIDLDELCRRFPNISIKDLELIYNETKKDLVYINDEYQVNVKNAKNYIHLSIKRIDKEPVHDWRDLQQIKNMLVGEETEAVELYPAESRLVDTANQYHLWVLVDDEGNKINMPFGYNQRLVQDEHDEISNVKQRKF